MKRIYMVLVTAVVAATATVFLLGSALAQNGSSTPDKPDSEPTAGEEQAPTTADDGSATVKEDTAQVDRRRGKRPPKTQTLTFTNATAIAIPAGAPAVTIGNANPYPSTINATGFGNALVDDVNVTLTGFSHTFPADVHILLQDPSGRITPLLARVGQGTNVTNLTLTLDDQAANPLPFAAALTSGTFKPTEANHAVDNFLATFNGTRAEGAWRLFVTDAAAGDTGSISGGWSIQITATTPKKKKRR